jgi:hypothetical protein
LPLMSLEAARCRYCVPEPCDRRRVTGSATVSSVAVAAS